MAATKSLTRTSWLSSKRNLGPKQGPKVFQDLREVNDPEAPTTTTKPFPYDGVPTGATPGAGVIDPGSLSASAAQAASVASASQLKASNFLIGGPGHSADGHPLAVMGPQLGYYYPEIVMQADLHGGGVDAQGVVAPISPYVFIGRGKDFAWSLTSAGSENTQQFLEKLCNLTTLPPTRESNHYIHNGKCIAMTHFDAGLLGVGPNGEPASELEFNETVHGPVSGTVTVGGQPYAVAKERSTRGGDGGRARLQQPRLEPGALARTVLRSRERTRDDVQHALRRQHAYRVLLDRAPADPRAGHRPEPAHLGTGQYDWRGFLSQEQHPHEVAPKSDTFLNWNNKPAPGWGAASTSTPTDRCTVSSCTRASNQA